MRFCARTLVLAFVSMTTASVAMPQMSFDSVELKRNEMLSSEDTQADLAILDQAYRELHPGLNRYLKPDQWKRSVDSLRTWFGKPRSRGDTYLALARLTASIKCGHTYLNFWNQPDSTKRWLLEGADKIPFTFALASDDKWIVARSAVSGLSQGDTISAVNGIPTPTLVARMIGAVRADGGNDGKRRSLIEYREAKQYYTTDALLSLIAPPVNGSYSITVRSRTIHASATTAARRDSVAIPLPAHRATWSYRRDGATGILTSDGFAFSNSAEGNAWPAFLDETFGSLRRDSVRTLVVDLRLNEGGSDDGALLLLRHLITAPIDVPPSRRFTVYDTVVTSLRPLLKTWDKSFFDRRGRITAHGDGTFDLKGEDAQQERIDPHPDAFAGRIIILTSYVNSSASHGIISLLKGRPNVTLIGEPTGGSLRASTGGNFFFLSLPHTGFEADIPLIAYDHGLHEPSGGVEPDIRVPVESALIRALGNPSNGQF